MEKNNLHPVFWKAVVLVKRFYPELGMRSIRNTHFAIAADESDIFR
ncbi:MULTISPECIES: hypothetical protein [unclassified Coleofasciculus]|nr:MULTISPECIES: hypothetical protein [unclassified Coleofasciculus]MBE9125762.1 hypothetical protein [Coleofasciculus sp. LEGE 07081]MBE9148435.1 hypothetical protein [Coleofasciculus sp. LEGE 07092]